MPTLKITVPVFAEFYRRIQKALGAPALVHKELERASAIHGDVLRASALIETRMRQHAASLQSFRIVVPDIPIPKPNFDLSIFLEIDKIYRRERALDEAEWLPHPALPPKLIENNIEDSERLRLVLQTYYQDNWHSIAGAIQERVLSYPIDVGAKETLKEALQAHRLGLFRCVPRVLFPEIERVARKELHGDRLRPQRTSLEELRDLAGQLSPGQLQPTGFYGMSMYSKLIKHFYERIGNDADLRRFALSQIPNRHASLHGLVTYDSSQSSINAIVMADFLFQVVSVLKGYMRDEESAATN